MIQLRKIIQRRKSLENVCNLNLCGIFNYFLKMNLEGAGMFQGKRTSLLQLMREISFGYSHVNNKRNFYEQSSIIEERHYFLRRMRRNVENLSKTHVILISVVFTTTIIVQIFVFMGKQPYKN